jgi:beta-glucosidase
VPLVVTENGIATTELHPSTSPTSKRPSVGLAPSHGVHGLDVRGYFQRSSPDNFEWILGYSQKFGIVEVDRQTFERRPKASRRAGSVRWPALRPWTLSESPPASEGSFGATATH